MAVTLAFRIAIALAPVGVRLVRYVQSPRLATLDRRLHGDLGIWPFDDEELESRVSSATGTLAEVVFTEVAPFELRKCQVMFARGAGVSGEEDMAVCTFHFLKLDAGEPTDSWDPADYEVFEAAFDTFWGTIKGKYFPQTTTLRQYRWYATGPGVEAALGGPGRTGPPRRVTDRLVAGTSGLTPNTQLPPQVAISITEKTSDPKSWGRFYLPPPDADNTTLDVFGRIPPTWQAFLADKVDDMYDACLAANIPVVVYSAAKPERPTAAGGTLEATVARALSVDEIQVDDLYDVIRSRRWKHPALRVLRTVD